MEMEMEVEEIESALEKICDLHDKLSDAIHSISRAHFLSSVRNPRNKKKSPDDPDRETGAGFVFMKDFRVGDGESAVQEAKSLYAIRTALENLEDQLEFFQTVQMQQLAERDSALARLEQSRIFLAVALSEYQGKKYKVIEEAQALVGDVQNASHLVSPDHLFGSTPYPSGESFSLQKGERPNPLINFFFSTLSFVSNSLKLDHTVGILGNAALLAISILTFVQMSRDRSTFDGETTHVFHALDPTSSDRLTKLDVFMARG
ncbi:plastid division protein PDV1-like [Primulina eburnea]|uniref:plastid division protein PDV1-like n=1 Tax=Primulina eburnea TaxID=1245227 RepID=UPI003C6C4E4E